MRFAVAAPAPTSRSSLFLAAGLLATLSMALPAAAQSCAVDYRKALDGVRDKRAEPLAALVRNIRAADPQLSGKWLFSAALFDASRKPKTERVCAETTELRGGRSKCVRYETRTIPRADEPAIVSPSSAEETKDLKALAQFVEGKGAVPELGSNGRFGFLFQRLAQDLRSYLTQEPHPALCAGGADLTEFYDTQLAPLKRRQAETTDLAKRTRAAAIARVTAIHKAEAAAYEKAVAPARNAAAASQSATPAAAVPAAGNAAAIAAPVSPPAPSPPPADYDGKSLIGLIEAAVRPLATDTQKSAVASATSPVAALAAARTAVIASQQPTADKSVDPAVRDAAGHALRMLEAATYADLIRARYVDVEATLFTANADIRAAHKASCTCAD